MRIRKNKVLSVPLIVLFPLLLQGCGGDFIGAWLTTTPTMPEVTLSPTATKTFAFNWNDVPQESEYRLLENPDGASGYSQVAVIPADSTEYDLAVSLPQKINASYILQACNKLGCTDSDAVFVSGSLAEAAGYVKASNTTAGDLFGAQVALSGNGRVMAVGAIREDGSGGDQDIGAVYVFSQDDEGGWIQQAYLNASNAGADDLFGVSLALSADGSVLAVGADGEGSGATGIDGDQEDNSADDSGAVYVFTQSGGAWPQQAYIKASNTEAGDLFGVSLALSSDGGVLMVGAPGEDSGATSIDGDQADNTVDDSGAVYVFAQNGGSWSQQAYIKASNTGEADGFGLSLELSSDGNLLAVGVEGEDSIATGIDGDQEDNSADDSGAVYVFSQNAGSWSQQAYIKASNTQGGDRFGSALALSGDGSFLAVGGPGEDSSAAGIDGDQEDNSADDSGAVYVFNQSAGSWSQQAYIKASNTGASDGFGVSLDLSSNGDLLAIGAYGEGSNTTGINGDEVDDSFNLAGAAYVFGRSDGNWSQKAYVKASNTEADDFFGISLTMSADGRLMAVGAALEDSSATGINGDQGDNLAEDSGAVYLY